MEDYRGYIPPSDLELEKAVLGTLMVDKTAIDRCSLQPFHFYSPDHQQIMDAIRKLASKNLPIDIITVSNEVKGAVAAYTIASLTAKVSSSANLEYHSTILIQVYTERELMSLCQKAIGSIVGKIDVFDIISTIHNRLDEFYVAAKKDFQPFKEISTKVIKKIEAIQESKLSVVGIDTGYQAMNEISHGFHAPDLVILAARPGQGKSAMALNLAHNVAKQNIPVLFFSLEMSAEQLAMRLISIITGIYSSYLTKAQVNEGGWHTIINANYGLPIYIDDTPSLNILEFKEKVRRAKKELGIGMIFVDYLQLMTAHNKGNREQEISTISRTLKMMAKELSVPILALAQMSREVEKSTRKPRLSDLRESGAIEQDADIVIALHADTDEQLRLMDVIYLKHRNGAVGTINLKFDTGQQKFYDL